MLTVLRGVDIAGNASQELNYTSPRFIGIVDKTCGGTSAIELREITKGIKTATHFMEPFEIHQDILFAHR